MKDAALVMIVVGVMQRQCAFSSVGRPTSPDTVPEAGHQLCIIINDMDYLMGQTCGSNTLHSTESSQ